MTHQARIAYRWNRAASGCASSRKQRSHHPRSPALPFALRAAPSLLEQTRPIFRGKCSICPCNPILQSFPNHQRTPAQSISDKLSSKQHKLFQWHESKRHLVSYTTAETSEQVHMSILSIKTLFCRRQVAPPKVATVLSESGELIWLFMATSYTSGMVLTWRS